MLLCFYVYQSEALNCCAQVKTKAADIHNIKETKSFLIPASALPYINYQLIHSTGWVESRKVCATYIFLIISHSEEKNQNIAMDYFIWESSLCKDVLWWYVRVWFLLKWEESTSSEFNHPPGSLVDPEWRNQQTRTLFHCCRGVIPK